MVSAGNNCNSDIIHGINQAVFFHLFVCSRIQTNHLEDPQGWHKVTCGRKYPGQKNGVGQINKTLKNNKLKICLIYSHWQNITFIFAYKIESCLKFKQKNE